MSLTTAGVIIISNRILENKKQDEISKYLIAELNLLQYKVCKVSIVPEHVSVISSELESMVRSCDVTIAIGDTNCCSVYKAIASLTSQELQRNEELVEIFNAIKEPYDDEEVCVPTPAKILSGNVYPVIYFQRIFILKEQFYEKSFTDILKDHLLEYRRENIFRKTLRISRNGNGNRDLEELNKLLHNCVKVDLCQDDKFFELKVSSSELFQIVEFEHRVKKTFGLYRLNFIDDSNVWERVYTSNEIHIRNAVENIEKGLEECGLTNIFLSFNGGKDCTVLLHLILAVIKKKYSSYGLPIFCLYVQSNDPFPEQDEFIDLCQHYYNLEILTIKSGIKDALQQVLLKYPNYKACFMGTRRTDPYSNKLNVFQMTDSDWPQIMRVSPLLNWQYSDIWDYLLFYKVPYCKLYDMGFTSLGNTVNTTKNPSLIYYDHFEGKEMYLPAYKLLEAARERNGRHSS